MKSIICFLVILIIVLATGCPSRQPKLGLKDEGYKKLIISQLKENVFNKEWVEYKCSNDGFYNTGITGKAFDVFTCGNVKKNSDNAQNIRNEVLDNSIGLIDSAYGVYIRDIRKNRSIGEFFADLVQLGGSTAGGIVNGERALQIIGVALTGFNGGRKSASLNFYDEKTTSILIKRMDASRSQILSEIKQNQQKSTVGNGSYSFDAGLDDIVRYFDAGTMNRAFTELDKQVSVDARIAEKGVLRIKNLADISDSLTATQSEELKNIFKELKRLSKNLEDKNKLDAATGILKSIYGQIVEGKKFDEIISILKSGNGLGMDEITEANKLEIKAAFKKFDSNQNLTGNEYLRLIEAILSQTSIETENGIIDKPELRAELLNYLKKAEVK